MMRIVRVTICLIGLSLAAACSEPPPPVSVTDFLENPRLLEATMVRCGQNRSEMKYESDCVNAREAINRQVRAEERARRAQLEAQSERKRQALRRTQEAAAAARRRSLEAERRREEAEYLGIFEEPAQGESVTTQTAAQQSAGNAPGMAVEPAAVQTVTPQSAGNAPGVAVEPAAVQTATPQSASNAPGMAVEPVAEAEIAEPEIVEAEEATATEASDLAAIREELRRRQQTAEQN